MRNGYVQIIVLSVLLVANIFNQVFVYTTQPKQINPNSQSKRLFSEGEIVVITQRYSPAIFELQLNGKAVKYLTSGETSLNVKQGDVISIKTANVLNDTDCAGKAYGAVSFIAQNVSVTANTKSTVMILGGTTFVTQVK